MQKMKAKIKGDVGIYKVWIIDWLQRKVYINRDCGLEWVSFDKIQQFYRPTTVKSYDNILIYEGMKVGIYHDEIGSSLEQDIEGVVVFIQGAFYVNTGRKLVPLWQEIATWKIIIG